VRSCATRKWKIQNASRKGGRAEILGRTRQAGDVFLRIRCCGLQMRPRSMDLKLVVTAREGVEAGERLFGVCGRLSQLGGGCEGEKGLKREKGGALVERAVHRRPESAIRNLRAGSFLNSSAIGARGKKARFVSPPFTDEH